MLSGLVFGLAGLFIPTAPLPDTGELLQEKSRFEQAYQVNMASVKIQTANWKNPSPLLASANRFGCTIYVNTYEKAHTMWSYLVSDKSVSQAQYQAYSLGHELGHCLIARPGIRAVWRAELESLLGNRFQTNTHFEETLCDLIGLAYAKRHFPNNHQALFERVQEIRLDLSHSDKSHDSRHALSEENIRWADALIKAKGVLQKDASASGVKVSSSPPAPIYASN